MREPLPDAACSAMWRSPPFLVATQHCFVPLLPTILSLQDLIPRLNKVSGLPVVDANNRVIGVISRKVGCGGRRRARARVCSQHVGRLLMGCCMVCLSLRLLGALLAVLRVLLTLALPAFLLPHCAWMHAHTLPVLPLCRTSFACAARTARCATRSRST